MMLVISFGGQRYKVPVDSFAHAREVFESCRDNGDYGASDMGAGCGDIFGAERSRIAHISYNGRVWDSRTGEEIKLS